MTILDKVARIVNGAREHEAERPFTFDRAEFERFADALEWLKNWHSEDGHCIWHSGDGQRRHLARHWLWMRYCFRHDITDRERQGHEHRNGERDE